MLNLRRRKHKESRKSETDPPIARISTDDSRPPWATKVDHPLSYPDAPTLSNQFHVDASAYWIGTIRDATGAHKEEFLALFHPMLDTGSPHCMLFASKLAGEKGWGFDMSYICARNDEVVADLIEKHNSPFGNELGVAPNGTTVSVVGFCRIQISIHSERWRATIGSAWTELVVPVVPGYEGVQCDMIIGRNFPGFCELLSDNTASRLQL